MSDYDTIAQKHEQIGEKKGTEKRKIDFIFKGNENGISSDLLASIIGLTLSEIEDILQRMTD